MEFIPVGFVVAAHGVKGEIKFRYYNDGADSLEYPSLFVQTAGTYTELKPTRIRRQRNLFIIGFQGLDTIEKSTFLLRKELFVAEKDLGALDEDEYYDYQLIGLRVVTASEAPVGRVKDVMHIRGRDILVIDGTRELLVPMTEDHIVNINRDDGSIKVRDEALLE